ncbi:MAG: arylesterase [Acidobacteria bacterium]|nr:arylesterase [Acidobacteriota bacterium]MCW5949807.1 arylesterase [Pyrinomonadaceae bacterium]
MYRVIRIFWALSFVALAICLNSCAAGGDRTRAPKPLKTPAEQDDRPKIIAFGDSLTAGFGLTEKESYPYLLQEKLRADGFDYDVVNAGVSGDTTLGGLERIDWALENDNVRILILELGANDLLRGIPPDKMRSNLDQIIRKTKAKGVRILLCGMLAPPTLGQQYQREFVNAFPDLATEHKLDFLPFLLEGIALNKDLNQPDGIHPNAEGSRIMTDNVYRALKPMLAK